MKTPITIFSDQNPRGDVSVKSRTAQGDSGLWTVQIYIPNVDEIKAGDEIQDHRNTTIRFFKVDRVISSLVSHQRKHSLLVTCSCTLMNSHKLQLNQLIK